jgi:hypothetical protein
LRLAGEPKCETAGDMAELRLVGVSEDGQHLVLADDSGDQHTIEIDERLRAGVNGHLSRLGQLTMALESRISPREIQERIRAGESAEHLAVTAGVPLERVLRFVGPVLREREHVADQARRARLGGATGPAVLLSDVVARAAARQGADVDSVEWDSARREDHSWIVTVTWPDGTVGTWALDLLHRQATPIDATARKVSGLPDESIEALHRSIGRAIDLDEDEADAEVDEAADRNVHLFVPRAVEPTLDEAGPGDDGFGDDDHDTAVVDLSAATPAQEAEPEVTQPAAPAPASANRSSRGARRARVPKWDDIMFGPKSKD